MGECKNCANADNEYCFACDNGNQFKPITNADRIRSMTDDELAEWLWSICCRISKDPCPEYKFDRLKRTYLAWVKKEVE